MTPEGDYVDFQNEDNRNPEEKPAQKLNNFLADSGANKFIFLLDSASNLSKTIFIDAIKICCF